MVHFFWINFGNHYDSSKVFKVGKLTQNGFEKYGIVGTDQDVSRDFHFRVTLIVDGIGGVVTLRPFFGRNQSEHPQFLKKGEIRIRIDSHSVSLHQAHRKHLFVTLPFFCQFEPTLANVIM